MTEDKITKPGHAKLPLELKTDVARCDLSNREGYRLVLSCNHDKSKTGSKAHANPRS